MKRTPFTLLAALLASARALAVTDRPISPVGAGLAPIPAGADLLFVVGGDNRPTGRDGPFPRVTRQIFSEVGLIRPDFVLWTGDTVYGKRDSPRELGIEYGRFTAAARGAGAPVFDAPGNHEIHHPEGGPSTDRASE
ncbi:MAG TPA: metallophosphoesterase family protein, partial [Thermoanaerobaculia bacterium]|nr:metallophosphoesterase family protein [Thermoanaerobaculia bacterium]